ncbi:hypothetical protein Saso_03330 [Streptomyces asoensis]|uniref:Integral membrane protein n=1 Tax=Streptomyces asoensis TaxID=249586 RepID=A0ABQ3RS64_9ACTN|nr:hypothetical protein GCM10010496_04250 [Streptomyces asoensis]GHI58683.1 hypothetical protein Saso_03330 [Streptomyces asoensis]
MRRWERALPAVERRLGTGEPPTRLEVAVARHPVRTGAVCGGVLWVAIVWALSGFGDAGVWLQTGPVGAGVGFLTWGACRLARRQQTCDERTGRAEEARRVAARKREAPLSPGVAVLLSLGWWVVSSAVFWVVGPLLDIPRTLPWAATYGALLTTVSVTGAWLRRRRPGDSG